MQSLVDLVHAITGSFQRVILLIGAIFIVVVLIITGGLTLTAPVVAEEIGERAEAIGERHINAAMEEQRALQCERYTRQAKDAWDRAVTNGTLDRDSARIDDLDLKRDTFCNS